MHILLHVEQKFVSWGREGEPMLQVDLEIPVPDDVASKLAAIIEDQTDQPPKIVVQFDASLVCGEHVLGYRLGTHEAKEISGALKLKA